MIKRKHGGNCDRLVLLSNENLDFIRRIMKWMKQDVKQKKFRHSRDTSSMRGVSNHFEDFEPSYVKEIWVKGNGENNKECFNVIFSV